MVEVKSARVDELIPYINNARIHSDEQVAQIAASIKEFGFNNPILCDGEKGVIAGHGRLMAARKLGLETVPVIELSHLSDVQKRGYILADNRLAENASWDEALVQIELEALSADDFDIGLTGFDLLDDGGVESKGSGSEKNTLSDKFIIPPFSVFNAREGWWQDRKKSWLSLGIKSEVGRGEGESTKKETGGLLMRSWTSHPEFYKQKRDVEERIGKEITTSEFIEKHFVPPSGDAYSSGTSIFDPVLCEISYRWFCPVGGTILDPFAGGSVRGIVASKLGRQYVGHELRSEQDEVNRDQAHDICCDPHPIWHCGDSRMIDKTCSDLGADMVFSCPPYADLEVYSDNPQDISTLGYEEFRTAYFEIIEKTCSRLKNDRFAVFVVGEVRDKSGNYYDFVGDTVEAFRAAGLHFYNEAILVTAIGSLPIRVGRQFSSSRKFGKTHQNVLVFVKGDGKKAAVACGDVIVEMPEGLGEAG